jgi:hypothetical protein
MKWIASLMAMLVAALSVAQTFQTSLNVDNPGTARQREFSKIVSYPGGYYVLGEIGGDLLIQRYNAAGALQAETQWDNPQSDKDILDDAKMDTAGNLYVLSSSLSNLGSTTWLTKFNAALAVQYERRLNSRTKGQLSVTPGGFGLVVAQDSANTAKFWVYAFAANGNQIWSASRDGAARCVLLDLNNRFWIGGNDPVNQPTLWSYAAITGIPFNTHTVLQSNIAACGFYELALDPNGTVYASGVGEGPLPRCLVFARFTSVFSYFVPNPAIETRPTGMAVDATSVFVATSGDSDGIYRLNKSLFGGPNAVSSVAAPVGEGYSKIVIEPTTDRVYGLTNLNVRQFTKALVQTSFQNLGASMSLLDMRPAPGGGGVLVAGNVEPTSPSISARVQRVNQNGSLGVGNTVGVSGEADHAFGASFVDPTGEAFGAGLQGDGVDALAKSFVHRVNRNGQLVWRAELANFEPRGVTSDGTNVFVVGSTPTLAGTLFTVKRLNRTTGAVIWSKDLTISGGGAGIGRSVATLNGDVVACGDVGTSGAVFRLLAATGDTVWNASRAISTFRQVVTFVSPESIVVARGNGATFFAAGTETDAGTLGQMPKMVASSNRVLMLANDGTNGVALVFDPEGALEASQASAVSDQTIYGDLGPGESFAWCFRVPNGMRLVRKNGADVATANISEIPTALVYGENDQIITYSQVNWVDPEGGNTSRISVRRYAPNLSLLQEQFITPPGPGLDSYAYNMLPGLQGQNWLFSTLERRGQGLVALYTRWRQEIAPVAVANAYTVTKGQTLTVAAAGVLINDSDFNGQALTAQLITNVNAGTLNLNANGGFTFVAPATAQVVTFTYRAVDSTGRTSNTVPVTITVVN